MTPVRRVHDRLRRTAAEQLRSRTAGDDPRGRARSIWGSPGERRFTPDDPIWRVHAHGQMFSSGLRALMLQALHPVAMAGVDQNSTYRDDPWARLQQISGFISVTTYGSIADAEAMTRRVRTVHSRIGGTAPNGRKYRTDDPDLLLWVHCAEIDSFLDGYQRWSDHPLSTAEADRYVEQAGVAGELIGVPDPPRTVADLAATIDSYRPVWEGTDAARDVARYLRRPPGLSPASLAGYRGLYDGAVAALPADCSGSTGRRVGSPSHAGTARRRWPVCAGCSPTRS